MGRDADFTNSCNCDEFKRNYDILVDVYINIFKTVIDMKRHTWRDKLA